MAYKNYNKKIENISKIIKQNNKLITTNRKGHNHRDLEFKKKQEKIDTNQFNTILSIDEHFIDCESSVNVGEINRKTIPRSKMVPSLPEGDNFTVGGCLGGLALGSNSYKHGFFNNNVVDFDIILGNGEIMRNVSKKEHSDLYYGVGGTYGTMGIITRV
ncbi:MAG: FAD-binding protein, partial [Candidatus Thermoplasmatota archaeon]|nr:FAD-binding protein [Candidatus Thermoplasmatota archaeon]